MINILPFDPPAIIFIGGMLVPVIGALLIVMLAIRVVPKIKQPALKVPAAGLAGLLAAYVLIAVYTNALVLFKVEHSIHVTKILPDVIKQWNHLPPLKGVPDEVWKETVAASLAKLPQEGEARWAYDAKDCITPVSLAQELTDRGQATYIAPFMASSFVADMQQTCNLIEAIYVPSHISRIAWEQGFIVTAVEPFYRLYNATPPDTSFLRED